MSLDTVGGIPESGVPDLTSAFLKTHRSQIVQALSDRLTGTSGEGVFPVCCDLLDQVQAFLGSLQEWRLAAGIRRSLDAGREGDPAGISLLVTGMFDLWGIIHRMLREEVGPHKEAGMLLDVLVLIGDTLDGVAGLLIGLSSSRDRTWGSPNWETLVELGKARRQFHTLSRIIRELLGTRNPGTMFQALERGILDTFNLRSLLIATVNSREGFVEVMRAYPSSPPQNEPIGWRYDLSYPEILCEVARSGRTEVVEGWDPRYHERVVGPDGAITFHQRPPQFNEGQAAFFVPILAQDRVVGVVCTASTLSGKPTVLREIEMMRPFLDQVGATLSTISEIIERQRAEEALRQSEEKYRTFVETAQEGVYAINPEGRITYANQRMADLLGYSLREVVGKGSTEFMDQAGRNMAVRNLARRRQGIPEVSEFQFIRKDGTPLWSILSTTPLFGAEGEFSGAVGMVTDITERKRAEEDIREREAQFRTLAESTTAAVFIYQEDRMVYANEAAAALTGFTREELQGFPFWEVIHPDFKDKVQDRGRRRLRGEEVPGRYEVKVVTKSGAERWMEFTGGLINLDGRPAALGTAFDITERKLARERLEQSEAQLRNLSARLQVIREEERTRIAREVHDELGQALTVLKMDTAWITKRLPPRGPARERAGSMLRMIDGTLHTVRRISTELRPGILDDLGLTAAIEWQAEEFQSRTGIQCGVTLGKEDIALEPSRATTVFRIFQETLTNITRHAAAHRVEVSLTQEGENVVLRVQDDGKGITPDQVASPRSLGLVGMRERAESCGGQVEISGGRGTRVCLRIPCFREETPE